jgi:hypothetical protein
MNLQPEVWKEVYCGGVLKEIKETIPSAPHPPGYTVLPPAPPASSIKRCVKCNAPILSLPHSGNNSDYCNYCWVAPVTSVRAPTPTVPLSEKCSFCDKRAVFDLVKKRYCADCFDMR